MLPQTGKRRCAENRWDLKVSDQQRILIVDDEPMIRNILKTVVEAEGFKGDTVQNGKEVVEHLKEACY